MGDGARRQEPNPQVSARGKPGGTSMLPTVRFEDAVGELDRRIRRDRRRW